jgi:site-specific DNA recombinase
MILPYNANLRRMEFSERTGRLLKEPSLTVKEIAAEERISSSYATRLLRLAFLAPEIVTAILNGEHPPQLTANRLMDDTRLPLDWRGQRERLCS